MERLSTVVKLHTAQIAVDKDLLDDFRTAPAMHKTASQ